VRFAETSLRHAPEADDLREEALRRYGKRGLVSLAFAMTAARLYPTLRYAMGHGRPACVSRSAAKHGRCCANSPRRHEHRGAGPSKCIGRRPLILSTACSARAPRRTTWYRTPIRVGTRRIVAYRRAAASAAPPEAQHQVIALSARFRTDAAWRRKPVARHPTLQPSSPRGPVAAGLVDSLKWRRARALSGFALAFK
jgi:hypothetical protein